MNRIPLIEREDASPRVRELYRRFSGDDGRVPNVMKVFAHDPPFFAGFTEMVEALYTDPIISPRHRELAWLHTSRLNACHY
jgi:alkylhydroperoxidase family enzyme